MASRTQSQRAVGGSMAPFIPSGSELTVREYDGSRLSRGDVVAYVRSDGVIAHRVLSVSGEPPHQRLRVCGDAQSVDEIIDQDAIAFVVLEVSRHGLRYRTDGALGRAFAHIAVRRGLPLGIARATLRAVQQFWPR